MARKERNQEEDQGIGAPEWMVTFSDCMTLLLTFFVLLLSFASFNKRAFESLSTSFAHSLPSVGLSFTTPQDSFWQNQQSREMERITKGSETRTDVQEITSNYMREKRPLDFRNLKVFTAESSKVFWGNGLVLTDYGKELCRLMGKMLRSIPGRIVISENGPGNDEIGLARVMVLLEEISSHPDVDAGRFSISSATTLRDRRKSNRMVEITILEEELYE